MARTRAIWRGVAAAVALGGLALLASTAAADGDEPVEAKAVLERLKGLAGTWVFTDVPEGLVGTKVLYRVTAAGSAVVEEQFPGSDHEMVSIYHLDGDELLMTHYCAAGNQPRLKLDRSASSLEDLRFGFDGGTNLDPARDLHIHEARIRLDGADEGRLTSDWTAFQDGKPMGTTTFTLRKE